MPTGDTNMRAAGMVFKDGLLAASSAFRNRVP